MRFISILLIPLLNVAALSLDFNMATEKEAPLGPFVMYTPAEEVPDPITGQPVQIPKKFVGIGKEKQPGQYPLELTTEASKAIRLTPTKAATASNGFYEFPAFSDGSQSAKGYLAVQEENVDHPRYREFVFVTDPVQSQTAPGKRFSYQNWKLDDKGSQALEIDLPGEWGIQRHRFVRVDQRKGAGPEAAVAGIWRPIRLFLEKVDH